MLAILLPETIESIAAHRWTEQFEALRMRTENYKQRTKDNVKVFWLTWGQSLNINLVRTSPQASSK